MAVANGDQKIGRRLYRLGVPVDDVVAAQGPSEQVVVHEIEVADGRAYLVVADESVGIVMTVAVSGFAALAAASSPPDPLADDVARDLEDQTGLLD